ncbi:MAG: PilZ domain-containing protein [Hahellaceae bacterium]|nr:PilZ domain-containing protein [Hahellaceae bacterium]
MKSSIERRNFPRLSTCLRVQVAGTDQAQDECWIRDMSEGGVFLRASEAGLEVGQTLYLRVLGLLRDKAVAVPARVVRLTGDGVAVNFVH